MEVVHVYVARNPTPPSSALASASAWRWAFAAYVYSQLTSFPLFRCVCAATMGATAAGLGATAASGSATKVAGTKRESPALVIPAGAEAPYLCFPLSCACVRTHLEHPVPPSLYAAPVGPFPWRARDFSPPPHTFVLPPPTSLVSFFSMFPPPLAYFVLPPPRLLRAARPATLSDHDRVPLASPPYLPHHALLPVLVCLLRNNPPPPRWFGLCGCVVVWLCGCLVDRDAGLKCGDALDLVTPALRMQKANAAILAQYRCLAETVSGNRNRDILKAMPRPAVAGKPGEGAR